MTKHYDNLGFEKGVPAESEKKKKTDFKSMRYRTGDFTIVPNIGRLNVVSTQAQALFMWICSYSDDSGICFPSRSTLARLVNIKSPKNIDKYIKELKDNYFIEVIKRKDEETGENMTNVYQILISGVTIE